MMNCKYCGTLNEDEYAKTVPREITKTIESDKFYPNHEAIDFQLLCGK